MFDSETTSVLSVFDGETTSVLSVLDGETTSVLSMFDCVCLFKSRSSLAIIICSVAAHLCVLGVAKHCPSSVFTEGSYVAIHSIQPCFLSKHRRCVPTIALKSKRAHAGTHHTHTHTHTRTHTHARTYARTHAPSASIPGYVFWATKRMGTTHQSL